MANITKCDYCFPDEEFANISDESLDLIQKCLITNPKKRLTATQALQHPFIQLYVTQAEYLKQRRLSKKVIPNIKRLNARRRWRILGHAMGALSRMSSVAGVKSSKCED